MILKFAIYLIKKVVDLFSRLLFERKNNDFSLLKKDFKIKKKNTILDFIKK